MEIRVIDVCRNTADIPAQKNFPYGSLGGAGL